MYLLAKERQADRETEEEQEGGHRVLDEDYSYRVAAAPSLPPCCYLSPPLSSHLRLGPPVAPGTPAPADKEGKRETGRTPEGNRCLRYPGFTYRERRRREKMRVRERGFRERKINISLDFVVLISKMIDYLVCCLFKSNRSSCWCDVTESCGKHARHSVSFNLRPRSVTSPHFVEAASQDRERDRHRDLNFLLKSKKNGSFAFAYFHFLSEEMSQGPSQINTRGICIVLLSTSHSLHTFTVLCLKCFFIFFKLFCVEQIDIVLMKSAKYKVCSDTCLT